MDTNTVAVVNQLGQKLDDYISVIAAKAGVAAEHFWPVLVKNQVIEGWSGIFLAVISVLALLTSIWLVYRNIDDDDRMDSKQTVGVVVGFITGIIFFVITCIRVSDVGENVAKINNPEYHAIQSLVRMVK